MFAAFLGTDSLRPSASIDEVTDHDEAVKLRTLELASFPEKLGEANRGVLNGKYVEHPIARMNRQPIFVGGFGNNFFIYFCPRENDWRIGVFLDWGPTLACMCLAFSHTTQGADILAENQRTTFPGVQDGKGWHALLDDVPHVHERGEQLEPPTFPGNGTDPFEPPSLDRTDQCTTTTTPAPQIWDAPTPYPSTGAPTAAPPGSQPAPAPCPPVHAPNVNVNLNIGVNIHKANKQGHAASVTIGSGKAGVTPTTKVKDSRDNKIP